ncbi:nucleoside-diphosphate-sugar epimerase [Lewinella marina]|nr:NAD-dependent epimerase/dehydratase family protein [Neolewinella marina]NJB85015.1 nucleoside-diphosphate-sugar epimerase [Neolewinella marina]
MPPDLLLTGATGFIGYYLSRTLAAAGRPFIALVRPDSDTDKLAELGEWCTLREGDVTDPESLADALEGVDTVVHAAARVSFQAGDEDEMLKVNAGGTANLVNMMLECGTPRLVYLSSVAALNRVDGGPPTGIDDRWPLEEIPTAYGRSKFAAEREVWRGQAEGLSVAALYPSIVLGAGDWNGQNTPGLWRRAADGARAYPRGATGFVDVRDVARAVLTVIDRRIDRDRFLLNAANLSWREALTAIAESVSAPAPAIPVSRWQSSLLWPLEGLRSLATGRPPLITHDSHRNAQASYRYDGRPYVEATGNEYIPIADTIREVGQAFHLSRTLGEGLPATYVPLLTAG